jgi:hypothetical protein
LFNLIYENKKKIKKKIRRYEKGMVATKKGLRGMKKV